MKSKVIYTLLILSALSLYVWVFKFDILEFLEPRFYLELQNVADFKVIELQKDSKQYIKISGLCTNSSMNIRRLDVFPEGNSLIIEYGLTFMRWEGASGSFQFEIPIKNYINTMYFGKKRAVIWQRDKQTPLK